jgi:hypothetical protein
MSGHENSIEAGRSQRAAGSGIVSGCQGSAGRLAVVVAAAIVVLAGLWATATMSHSAPGNARETDPQCAALARVVAGRNHSMFDGRRYRATEQRVYGLCIADPAAFRRLVRGY